MSQGYAPLVLNLGDPAIPTTPANIWHRSPFDLTVNNPVTLLWTEAQDDVAVVDYDVYRDGQFIGSQTSPSNEYTGTAANLYIETHPTDASGLTRVAKYQVAARDAQGNVSPTLSMVYEVPIPETDLDLDGVGDFVDNCTATSNSMQTDTDADGAGDACDGDDDGDGLLDIHETNTGVYISPTDTGSDPLSADSDGDGFGDGAEVSAGSNPNDPLSTPAVLLPALGLAGRAAVALLLLGVGLATRRITRSRNA